MSFERDLSILAEVEEEITKTGRKLAINIDRRVVNETPRDTGSAKASWLVTINESTNEIVDGDGEELATAALEAIEKGAAESLAFVCGDTLFIQNNQPYINRLNEGWSEQAPIGFIDDIIKEEVKRAD